MTSPAELITRSDIASGFAAMSHGRQRQAFTKSARAHFRAALAADGPVDAKIAAMTDDELLAALGA